MAEKVIDLTDDDEFQDLVEEAMAAEFTPEELNDMGEENYRTTALYNQAVVLMKASTILFSKAIGLKI
jgi:hypothetical protein